ncbi:alpha/beta hydrolase [Halalkalicoccus salilacus]|uniref:alpha/beta hydrolase n=1 Tax=Halalkalicoccus sp. GCM10025704 TaxID=3252662 RepID=UPI00360B4A7D
MHARPLLGKGVRLSDAPSDGLRCFGGAEPGEVLATVERIDEGDTEAWHDEWRGIAERLDRSANEASREGRVRTARGAYLRAHNYYRSAEFFLPAADPRRRPTHERSREAFRSGIELFEAPVERVEIPYEGTTLPGYLFAPEDAGGPRPTVVCLGGFDSLCEELYFLCGVPEALARGYAVLLFEGPGQGAPLRYEGLTARPDWEHVVGPVLDLLARHDTVDSARIGLIGVSFGATTRRGRRRSTIGSRRASPSITCTTSGGRRLTSIPESPGRWRVRRTPS